MISIEDFFFDDPAITPENPWKPLPKHSLEQNPCYPIIGMHKKYRVMKNEEIIKEYRAKGWDWESTMLFIPVSFGVEHKQMLGNLKILLEKRHLAINPQFDKLLIALRTVTEKNEGILDKDVSAFNDTLDALRLARAISI